MGHWELGIGDWEFALLLPSSDLSCGCHSPLLLWVAIALVGKTQNSKLKLTTVPI